MNETSIPSTGAPATESTSATREWREVEIEISPAYADRLYYGGPSSHEPVWRMCEYVLYAGSANPDSSRFGPVEKCDEEFEEDGTGETYCYKHR